MTQTQSAPKTFLTIRMADGTSKAGNGFKRVTNLFLGGNDARGLPIFNNHEDKLVGFVGATSGKLNLYRTDKEGKAAVGEDGKIQKPVLSLGLKRFIDGHGKGLAAKGLEAGQGTITGPKAADLAKQLEAVVAKAAAAKAAA